MEKTHHQRTAKATYVAKVTYAAPSPLPTANVRVESDKHAYSLVSVVICAVSVVACAFVLFELYVSMLFDHGTLDAGLHKLEEEVHKMKTHVVDGNNHADFHVDSSTVAPYVHNHGDHRPLSADIRQKRHHYSRSLKSESQLAKRGGSVLTWFTPGTGACGGHNGNNDYIVAISHLIWDGGSHCGDTVTINYKGKTAQATVADECMSCEPGHIDLSPGLLHNLAGAGTDMVTNANWSFGSAPAPPPPKPKPSTTYTPSPTTTKAKPTSTESTHTTSTSTSATSSQTSSSASLTSSTSTPTPTASASATPAYVDDGKVHNLQDLNVLLLNFGTIIADGATAKAH